ncbi:hypothetical protein LUZ60_015899 [Juncus effusus]|nr:hypothetical protein LUZ60_015899 [Juncus effusus]
MKEVRIILNESILLIKDEKNDWCLRPDAEILLQRLKHANVHAVICHQEESAKRLVDFVNEVSEKYELDSSISLNNSNEIRDILFKFEKDGDIAFHVTSALINETLDERRKDIKIINIKRGNKNDTTLETLDFVNKLDQLLLVMCPFIKKEFHELSPLIIGYIMKPSRELDFVKRGAFPLAPTQNGLIFIPISFEIYLISQLKEIDLVLHKVTDEILSIDLNSSSDFPKGISLSEVMSELSRFIEENPDYCIIDPFEKIWPLLDRLQIQQILLGLQEMKGRFNIRAPHFLKVDNFNDPDLLKKLAEGNLKFPVLVKPQVACGVSEAHNMALVLKPEDFTNLSVPLPAVIQEYVDHGSIIYKVYSLGNKVFHAVRKSMPNSSSLFALSQKSGISPITFNSLKNLPVETEDPSESSNNDKQVLDVDLVKDAADWLKKRLNLTIFGFDVVIQEKSGDYVIVDLNYLPSFKEVPDSDAIPAFWDAIRSSYSAKKLTSEPLNN